MAESLHLRCRRRTLAGLIGQPLSEAALRDLARDVDGIWVSPAAPAAPPVAAAPTKRVRQPKAAPRPLPNRACLNCEVRGDRHRLHGCRTWR